MSSSYKFQEKPWDMSLPREQIQSPEEHQFQRVSGGVLGRSTLLSKRRYFTMLNQLLECLATNVQQHIKTEF